MFKLKRTKLAQSKWSRENFRDIFKKLTIGKEIVKLKEKLFVERPSAINRVVLNKAHIEYTKYLKFEDDFWRQKTGIQWFTEGYRNTRFFHSLVKGRRKRLEIKRMQ